MKFHGLGIKVSFIVDFSSITMGRRASNLIVTTPYITGKSQMKLKIEDLLN